MVGVEVVDDDRDREFDCYGGRVCGGDDSGGGNGGGGPNDEL